MTTTETEVKTCERQVCDQTFMKQPNQRPADFRKKRFCTLTCALSHVAEEAERVRTENARPCGRDGCDNTFVRRSGECDADWESRQFCSSECGRLGIVKRSREDRLANPRPCEGPGCGKQMIRRAGQSTKDFNERRFCSRECLANHQAGGLVTELKVCAGTDCCNFMARKPHIRRTQWEVALFCSTSCSSRSRAKKSAEVRRTVVETKECVADGCTNVLRRLKNQTQEVWDTRTCCGKTCAARVARASRQDAPIPEKACARCGAKMVYNGEGRVQSFRKRLYCSDPCRNAMRAAKASNGVSTVVARQKRENSRNSPSGLPRPVFPGPAPEKLWRPPGWSSTPNIGAATEKRKAS